MVEPIDKKCLGTCAVHDITWDRITEITDKYSQCMDEFESKITTLTGQIEGLKVKLSDKNDSINCSLSQGQERFAKIEKSLSIFTLLILGMFSLAAIGWVRADSVREDLQTHINSDTKEFASLTSHLDYHAKKAPREDQQEKVISELMNVASQISYTFKALEVRLERIEKKL